MHGNNIRIQKVNKMISEIALEITQQCLNNCIYCSSCSSWETDSQLNINVVKSVINDMEELGINKICISGGEPFLHPDILGIIEYATQKKINVVVYSSGIIGTKEKTSSLDFHFLQKCKDKGLSRIIFNMEANDEVVYDKIMNTVGNFSKLIESMKNAKKTGIKTEIHFVPMKINLNQVNSVINLAEKLGIDTVSFLRLVTQGRAFSNKQLLELNLEEYKKLNRILQSRRNESKINLRLGIPLSESSSSIKCHAVTGKLAIRYDGAVLGCEAFKGLPMRNSNNVIIEPDNIKTKRLKEIVKSSTYLQTCCDFINNNSDKRVACENCPVQEYMKEQKNG